MKSPLQPLIVALILASPFTANLFAQGQCSFSINMVNNNRYAYDTAEECAPNVHSVPFGNWGVSSNVDSKQDAGQPGYRPIKRIIDVAPGTAPQQVSIELSAAQQNGVN